MRLASHQVLRKMEDQVIRAMSRPVPVSPASLLLEISNDTAKAPRTHPKTAPQADRLGADDLSAAQGISGGTLEPHVVTQPCQPALHAALGILEEMHAFECGVLRSCFSLPSNIVSNMMLLHPPSL